MLKNRFLSRVFFKLYTITNPYFDPKSVATENDFYLVSYPRSGNTWLRAMLAELLFEESGESIKDIQHYVPDIHVATLKGKVASSKFHVFKSHARHVEGNYLNSKYKKVIYLVRDPRDVVISYFRYWKGLKGYQKGFDSFFLSGFTVKYGHAPGKNM